MEENKDVKIKPNEAGTPQGGIISPLLCNIALHGLETQVLKGFSRDKVKIIRYADDFIITASKIEDIHKAKEIAEKFLATMDLELSIEKTRIGHTMKRLTNNRNEKIGLDFLGFHFRNIETSKRNGVKNTRGEKQAFKQISSPTRMSSKRHFKAIKQLLNKMRGTNAGAVIGKLKPIISG